MKLVMAIIHDDDAVNVMNSLGEAGFFVTKLATTGGFLKSGNTTLISGVDDDKVCKVISIFEQKCKSTVEHAATPYGNAEGFTPYPVEIKVGGATVFVIDVDKFYKF
ncbi:MAG: cyclic-di-AMP receptor [Lachnospiraceae bacterium]|nr:cyclic-di-AMP receptor [Lachnospiraceae bacterium]